MEIIEDEVRDLKREKFMTFVGHYNIALVSILVEGAGEF